VDPRPILAYVNFATSHNEEKRSMARARFRSVATEATNISQEQYLKDVVRSKFVVSPPGNHAFNTRKRISRRYSCRCKSS
jgi:hypothetical protein